MPKKTGFKIKLEIFVPIDKTNFAAQAATYAAIAKVQAERTIPAELLSSASVLSVAVKQASADIPDAPATDQGEQVDPANVPLTTDPLPEGAEILEATTDLTGNIFQTIRLADGTEQFRRISADQDATEVAARAAAAGKKK